MHKAWQLLLLLLLHYWGEYSKKNKARKRRDHVYPMKKGGRVEYVIESPSRKPLKEPSLKEERKEKDGNIYLI